MALILETCEVIQKFPLTATGVLATGFAHARPSARHEGTFFGGGVNFVESFADQFSRQIRQLKAPPV